MTWEERLARATERAESRLDKSGDCWLWPGATNGGRGHYGVVGIKTGEGRKSVNRYVHRLMYEKYIGPIPDGTQIDHLCGVRLCANPQHLEAVAQAENARRAAAKVTHCPVGHPYDPENTHVSREGKRVCRACRREAKYQKRRSAGVPERGRIGRMPQISESLTK